MKPNNANKTSSIKPKNKQISKEFTSSRPKNKKLKPSSRSTTRTNKSKPKCTFLSFHKHLTTHSEKSSVINRERITKMQTRYELVEKLRELLQEKFKSIVSDQAQYKELMHKFILQVHISLDNLHRVCSE